MARQCGEGLWKPMTRENSGSVSICFPGEEILHVSLAL
jgi:hypothetical protein